MKLSVGVPYGTAVKAAGGQILQQRRADGLVEAWVTATVPAMGSASISLEADSNAPKAAVAAVPVSRFGGAMPLLFLGFALIMVRARKLRA